MATKSTTTSTKTDVNKMYVPLAVGVVLGFAIGFLYAKVQFLEKGGTVAKNDNQKVEQQDTTQPTANVKVTKPDPKTDHWLGKENANIVLIEYSDFECPFCGQFYDTVKQVEKDYANDVALVYRHFPLSFHPKAEPSAEASECVFDQGGDKAFWKMHDMIFEGMPALEVAGLGDLAVKAGVNKTVFQKCMDDAKFKAKVQKNLDEGTNAGVGATPTSVVYNMKTGETEVIEGALPYDSVKQTLDKMLGK
jgi:protein-disulfide isomerase